MCYIQVKNIRLNSFYEEKKIKLCLTKQLLNMFKLWCEWGIRHHVTEQKNQENETYSVSLILTERSIKLSIFGSNI